jgi:23S rRNA pseudouridine2605 synthase
MRINKFIAGATGLSRRAADRAIGEGRVALNGQTAGLGDMVTPDDTVALDGRLITTPAKRLTTIICNKPPGYVCSRSGQGSPTVYELLPPEYHDLHIAGRLDKDSSGLVVLTNDGELAHRLTHPRYAKTKLYEIALDRPLAPVDQARIEQGLQLDDGISALKLEPLGNGKRWRVTMREGRNRQIRRTFAALGYTVQALHRTLVGAYNLEGVKPGRYKLV